MNAPDDNTWVDAVILGTNNVMFPNTSAIMEIRDGTTVLDAAPDVDAQPGISWSVKPGFLTIGGNDTPGNWCDANMSLNGFDFLGSPGIANVCP